MRDVETSDLHDRLRPSLGLHGATSSRDQRRADCQSPQDQRQHQASRRRAGEPPAAPGSLDELLECARLDNRWLGCSHGICARHCQAVIVALHRINQSADLGICASVVDRLIVFFFFFPDTNDANGSNTECQFEHRSAARQPQAIAVIIGRLGSEPCQASQEQVGEPSRIRCLTDIA